jgi:beta-galactosidase
MYQNGGPVIMVQIENEYGNYAACDMDYIRHLGSVFQSILGFQSVLFTTDPPEIGVFLCGNIPDVAYGTIDFGTGASIATNFKIERDWNRAGPYVNSEFYPGWLDHWGEPHHTVPTSSVTRDLDTMLGLNASVNIYMYYGGTDFGFYSGANGDTSSYQPQPTSYDYDAPLSEAGDLTYKWSAIRDVIKKYRPDIPTYTVANTTKRHYGPVTISASVSLFDGAELLADVIQTGDSPLAFEDLDLGFGFVFYRAYSNGGTLNLPTVHDRAYVYVDKTLITTIQRPSAGSVSIPAGALDILVENQGRINYGNYFVEKKGLVGGATVAGQGVGPWKQYGFNLSRIGELRWSQTIVVGGPVLYKAVFQVDEPGDTFFNPTGLSKGVAFVNGFNIGRYWTIGPQLTLFVPKALLKSGDNELIIFEQESLSAVPTLTFDDTPQISII